MVWPNYSPLEETQRAELTLKEIAEMIQKADWVKFSGG